MATASKSASPLPSELLLEPQGRSLQGILVGASVAVHLLLGVGIGVMEVRKSHAATAIEIASLPAKRAEPPPPVQVQPEPPKAAPTRSINRPAAAPAKAAPEPEPARAAKEQAAHFDALPDFGLALSGSGDGPGLAVPVGPAAPRSTAKAPPIVRHAPSSAPKNDASDCDEPASKPRAKSVPQPNATEEARALGIEGKVRVELTVDEGGNVVSVRLLSGLGHGLDEAALAAARRAEFEPALRCGKPVRATFVISMRFSAG